MDSTISNISRATSSDLTALPPAPQVVEQALNRAVEAMDFGLLIVSEHGRLHHANRCARAGALAGGALRVVGDQVVACEAASQARLRGALVDAARGLRRVLGVRHGEHSSIIATLPLQTHALLDEALVLVVLERQPGRSEATLALYASALGLTGAEARVLSLLSGGLGPKQIATRLGVALSTVRTQLQSIRAKTGSSGLRDLLSRVSLLPPVAGVFGPWSGGSLSLHGSGETMLE